MYVFTICCFVPFRKTKQVEELLECQVNKDTFLDEQIEKYTSEKERLRSLAVNIVRLSHHLDEKMYLIRKSFYITVASIVLLGAIVILLSLDKIIINPT